jgi:hypothetical protein
VRAKAMAKSCSRRPRSWSMSRRRRLSFSRVLLSCIHLYYITYRKEGVKSKNRRLKGKCQRRATEPPRPRGVPWGPQLVSELQRQSGWGTPLQSAHSKCDPVPAFFGATRKSPVPHSDSWPGLSPPGTGSLSESQTHQPAKYLLLLCGKSTRKPILTRGVRQIQLSQLQGR